jgi:hypothetical protein
MTTEEGCDLDRARARRSVLLPRRGRGERRWRTSGSGVSKSERRGGGGARPGLRGHRERQDPAEAQGGHLRRHLRPGGGAGRRGGPVGGARRRSCIRIDPTSFRPRFAARRRPWRRPGRRRRRRAPARCRPQSALQRAEQLAGATNLISAAGPGAGAYAGAGGRAQLQAGRVRRDAGGGRAFRGARAALQDHHRRADERAASPA